MNDPDFAEAGEPDYPGSARASRDAAICTPMTPAAATPPHPAPYSTAVRMSWAISSYLGNCPVLYFE